MNTLEQQIEEEMANAIERIVRLSQRAAIAAFERHFEKAVKRTSDKPVSSPKHPLPGKRQKRNIAPRRSPAEIISLTDRLLKEVRADPGQTMSVLAPRLGVSAVMLQVPVAKLKATKKVKTVGQRHFTQYFPAAHHVAA